METPSVPTHIPAADLERINASTEAIVASNDALQEAMHAVLDSDVFQAFVAICAQNKEVSQEAITTRSGVAIANKFTLDDGFNTRTGRIERKQKTIIDENIDAMAVLWQLTKKSLSN